MPARHIPALLTIVSCAASGQALLDVTPPPAANPSTTPFVLTLRDATPIRMRLTRELTFATVKPGEMVDFEILDDLRIDGLLVITHGAKATATIRVAEPKTRLGRGGKLGVDLPSIPLLNRDRAAIRTAQEGPKGGPAGAAAGPADAVSRPAAPAFLLTFGKDEKFPEGSGITAYIDGESKLDASRFLVDMAFASNPQGAMVSMYGAPIGRTPFTTKLAAGTYKIVFSATGQPELQESIVVGPGHANTVTAMFEPKP